jgi:hypothetical protein
MAGDMAIWLFWFGAAAIGYGTLSAFIRYVYHWRRGARIMAAQAAVQAVLCTFGIAVIWAIHQVYLPG